MGRLSAEPHPRKRICYDTDGSRRETSIVNLMKAKVKIAWWLFRRLRWTWHNPSFGLNNIALASLFCLAPSGTFGDLLEEGIPHLMTTATNFRGGNDSKVGRNNTYCLCYNCDKRALRSDMTVSHLFKRQKQKNEDWKIANTKAAIINCSRLNWERSRKALRNPKLHPSRL